ncbi:MAG: PilZ domain-containing protein [Halobacteriovoraceae bacterium]|nr:PilZ domain-containing protein [Halobacteriovoraceae bacterium]
MRDLSKNFNYRQDYYFAIYLLFALMACFEINLILEVIYGGITGFHFTIVFIASLIFFKFYHDALKNLMYTFWGLTSIFLFVNIYFFLSSLTSNYYQNHSTITFIMLVIHLSIIYLASSPVYYPRVSWWEYDFRYRADIEITTIVESEEASARLTDLRRGGGSIVSFDQLELGTKIRIKFNFNDRDYNFPLIIGSRAQSIPGRPISYGVKFILDNQITQDNYQIFLHQWKSRSQVALANKFNEQ